MAIQNIHRHILPQEGSTKLLSSTIFPPWRLPQSELIEVCKIFNKDIKGGLDDNNHK